MRLDPFVRFVDPRASPRSSSRKRAAHIRRCKTDAPDMPLWMVWFGCIPVMINAQRVAMQ